MFKKIFAIATLLCVIPVMANAATKWQLGTRAMSQGGVINSRNMTGQTVANGGIFKQYTTATNSTVTVTANPGFKISKISNNGIITVAPIASPYINTPAGTGNVSIQATFARLSYALNAIVGAGGTVNRSSYPIVYVGTQSPAKTFIITPNAGKTVTAITASAGVLNTNFQYLSAVTGQPTALGVVNERVKISVVNVPSNITFSATFGGTATPPPPNPGNLTAAQLARVQCVDCHSTQGVGGGYAIGGVYNNWSTSGHKANAHGPQACYVCHAGANAGAHPGNVQCASCHTGVSHTYPQAGIGAVGIGCARCHTATEAHAKEDGCIDCHVTARNAGSQYVQDNNGVRSITQEFTKWSHHVTGVTLNNSHCAACHLAGKQSPYGVHVDPAYHLADNKIHLRNADDDSDMVWDPASPNHTTMDNFCLSCHDANGAISTGSVAIQAYLNTNNLTALGKTASPSNPFGDTISNQYDKMQRSAVVNAKDQFKTTNPSHHAVMGKRYSGRSRVANGGTIADAAFTANSSANLPGKRTTIFEAGKFNPLYVTLKNDGGEADSPSTLAGRNGGTKLGDDSTLHCGDCHTVGQWKAGSSLTANGSPTPVAIGAHGSANEYLLRNSIGTDARHQGIQMDANAMHADSVTPYLVCYNCHAIANYGLSSHIGEQVVGENNCDTPTNTNTVNAIGTARITSQYTMSYDANVVGTPTGATNGNIYGIQCNNCHNSGISAGNIYGGIHGSADSTYKDGAGNTTKHERFLPGLGNVMYVPGTRGGITGGTGVVFQSYSSKVQTSGISKGLTFKGTYGYTTGGVTNDTNWEEKTRIPVGDGVTGWSHNPGAAGCYTISEEAIVPANAESNGVPAGPPASLGLTDPNGVDLVGNWGGCVDHGQQQGASVRQPRNTNTSIRPVTY